MKKTISLLLPLLICTGSLQPLSAKNKASQTEQHVSYQEDNAPVETIYVNETNGNNITRYVKNGCLGVIGIIAGVCIFEAICGCFMHACRA